MKMHTSLAGVGAALVFALAAHGAEAGTQCPIGTEGDGGQQIEVGQEGVEPCQPSGTSSATTTFQDGAGTTHTAEITFEGPNDMLEIGEVVEIEIEYDDVMAFLKQNEQEAMELATGLGIRPSQADTKSGATNVSNAVGASRGKLTDVEFEVMAKHVYVSMQSGRATGRSDPATSSWRSRIDHGVQAAGRLFHSIGAAVGRAIPDVRIRGRETIRDGNNVVRRETSIEVDITS